MANFRVRTTKRGYYDVEAANKDEAREVFRDSDVEFEEKEETVEDIEKIN